MMIHSILRQASDGGSSHQNEQSYLAGGQALKRWIGMPSRLEVSILIPYWELGQIRKPLRID